jgi:hypothetical protein
MIREELGGKKMGVLFLPFPLSSFAVILHSCAFVPVWGQANLGLT